MPTPVNSPLATVNLGGNSLAIPNGDAANRALDDLAAASQGSGMPLLKYDQSGHWTYGADQTPLSTPKAVVLMATMERGVVAWHNSSVADERMESVFKADPTPVADWGPPKMGEWEGQLSVQVSVDNGATVTIFKTSTGGGKERLAQLGGKMSQARATHPEICMVEVELDGESYINQKYGKRIFKPVFKVINWLDENGKVVDVTESGESSANNLL